MELNMDLAYIFGVYIGDGCIWDNGKGLNVFGLEAIDKDFVQYTAKCLRNLTGKRCRVRSRKYEEKQDTWRVQVSHQDLINKLFHDTHAKTHIPKIILNAPNVLKRAFVAGVLDSEGYVSMSKRHTYNNYDVFDMQIGVCACDCWLYELHKMLQDMGVQVGSVVRSDTSSGRIALRFIVNKRSFIQNKLYFRVARKQDRIDYYKSIFPSSTTIRGIPRTEKTKKRISEKLKGRKFTAEHKLNLIGAWTDKRKSKIQRDPNGRFIGKDRVSSL